MNWLNPWAWIGAIAIAIPIAVHLLGRRHPRRQVFPTLRFLSVSRLVPARRTRPVDLALLAIRIGIVLLAVAALAQPVFLSRVSATEAGRAIVRAILVDTSASMSRPTPGGARAVDTARLEAARLAREATRSTAIESADPRFAVSGAVAWLGTNATRRELVVISDFQLGTIDAAGLAVVPQEIGVRLVRIDVKAGSGPALQQSRTEALDVDARVTASADASGEVDVQWTTRRREAPRADQDAVRDAVSLLAAAAEAARAEASLAAALAVGAPRTLVTDRSVAIVFPQAEQRTALLSESKEVDQPWMFDVMQAASTPLAKTGRVKDRVRLLLFPSSDPGTVESASLIASVLRAVDASTPMPEQAPTVLTDTALKGWERSPATGSVPPVRAPESAHGRWLWVAALILLAIETWMRRSRATTEPVQVPHERVA